MPGDLNNEQIRFQFVKEIINKEVRNVKVVNKFLPNVRNVPITSKFYSKFETVMAVDNMEKHDNYLLLAELQMKNGPREKYCEPVTGNQEYGWLPGPFTHYDARERKLLYFPKVNNHITKVGEKIAQSKVTEREPFSGIPFSFRFDK